MPAARPASIFALAVFFGLSLAAFFAALSAAQLTTIATGERIQRRAIAVSTGLDAALPGIRTKLQAQADSAQGGDLQVPDFPIAVRVTPQEAQTLPDARLRDVILTRAAHSLYEEGGAAWASSDPQATRSLSRFSAAGGLDAGLGRIHDSTHTQLLVLTVVLGLVTLVFASGLFVSAPWDGRLVLLGGAGALAALPLLAAAVAARFAFRTAGPDGDAFVQGLFDIGADGMWVPVRNYLVLAVVSFGVLLCGSALLWWESRNVQAGGPAQ